MLEPEQARVCITESHGASSSPYVDSKTDKIAGAIEVADLFPNALVCSTSG